ncbi:ABC transporter permease [Nitratireductor pacificus]|uniref:ABC transporter permease n=1 Tax=Nitratireductor pacificus pht-3B TaxID=391937 RepID=K2LKP2_9HYPH|nr:ABC transporter permease [Nitratireductor pacificus]EKF18319.1 ABC transporter permease [Nitratireductor pacificus pht-3B]
MSILNRFLTNRLNASLGLMLISVFLLAAILGSVWTPHDPLLVNFGDRLRPPGGDYWLGTDQYGRDTFSRILVGARESLTISSLSVAVAVVSGTVIGALAGYFAGLVDRAIGTVMDALIAFPSLLLALGIVAAVGPGKYGVIVALGVSYAPGVARIVRATVMSLRGRDFIDSARALGNSHASTLIRHVLPNCIAPVAVIGTSLFATALLSESALAFLGLGVPPPNPTWGGMLADTKQFATSAVWLVLAPGLAISMTLLAVNLLGDALRDFFDPRMEQV